MTHFQNESLRNSHQATHAVIPALDRIADTAPAVAEATADLVPVFFFVEELFCVFLVEVVLLTAVPDTAPL